MPTMKTFLPIVLAVMAALCGNPADAKEWTHVRLGVEGAFPPWNMIGADGKVQGIPGAQTQHVLLGEASRRAELPPGRR